MAESEATRMFRRVRQVAAPVGRQTTLFGRVRQVAAPGAKSAVSDCILLEQVFVQVMCYFRRRTDSVTALKG